jgi:type IV pilus assembly protein PilM
MRSGLRRLWAGLDVGSFSVKLLAHQPAVGGPRHPRAEVLLPAATPDAPTSPDVIARAIAECFTQSGIAPRGVRGLTLGIAGPDVVVKQISLPLLADEEVGPALRFEARKHLPFDLQSMVIDFQIVGRYLSERRLTCWSPQCPPSACSGHSRRSRRSGWSPPSWTPRRSR